MPSAIMPRKFFALLPSCAILLLIPFAAGCTRYVYEIDLTPHGNELERTLVASNHDSADKNDNVVRLLPREVLRLEEVYQQPSFQVDDDVRISGMFTERMPQDIGGFGTYTHWETSLGSASLYLERFRGGTNLMQQLEQRLKAADLAVDLLQAFVDVEAANSDVGIQLRKLVDGEFRSDAKDLTLLIWALQAVHDEFGEPQQHEATYVRIFEFLLERNYLAIDDLPQLLLHKDELDDQQGRMMLTRKLEMSEDKLIAALPALASKNNLEASFDAAVINSDAYRRTLKTLPALFDIKAADLESPGQVFTGLLLITIGSPLNGHDELIVRLHPPEAPFMTNGTTTDEGTVEWSTELTLPGNPQQHALPTLYYAIWSEPNVEMQSTRFGKVLLTGQSLSEYVVWRRALDTEAGQEWDAFVATLTPADDLEARLGAFRFSTTPADVDTDPRIQSIKNTLLKSATSE